MNTIKKALTTLDADQSTRILTRIAGRVTRTKAPTHLPARGDCWTWTGAQLTTGYGVIRVPRTRQMTMVHRAVYIAMFGPISHDTDGTPLTLDHLCRNTLCCNPHHLEQITHAENIKRAAALITHCPDGHEYTPDNTRTSVDRNGHSHRSCRTCQVRFSREYRDRARARKALATAA